MSNWIHVKNQSSIQDQTIIQVYQLSYGKFILKKKQSTVVLITSGEVVWIRAVLVLDQIWNLFDITYVLTLLTMITIKKRINLVRTKFQVNV